MSANVHDEQTETVEQFIQEMTESVSDFYGMMRVTVTPELKETILCLDAETRILQNYHDASESSVYQDAMDVLLTVSEKLGTARLFRSLVGRLAGLHGKDDDDRRMMLLSELASLLEATRQRFALHRLADVY